MPITRKSPGEISQLFRKDLLPTFRRVYILQKDLQITVLQLVGVSIFLYAFSKFFAVKYPLLAGLSIFAMIGHGVFVLVKKKPWEMYFKIKSEFKSDVITKIVQGISPDLHFEHNCEFPSQYSKADLFDKTAHIKKAEDQISGVIDGVGFFCCEIYTAEKIESRNSKGKKTSQIKEIFKGLFFVADFHKQFKGRTVIRTDKAESTFGYLGRSLQRVFEKNNSLVELEDQEFEKYFKVLSDDQQEARYILSVNFMQKILELRKKYETALQISFVDSEIIVAIPSKKNRFEFKGSKYQDWELQTHEYFDEFYTIIELIEDLQLNNKVWNQTKVAG